MIIPQKPFVKIKIPPYGGNKKQYPRKKLCL